MKVIICGYSQAIADKWDVQVTVKGSRERVESTMSDMAQQYVAISHEVIEN